MKKNQYHIKNIHMINSDKIEYLYKIEKGDNGYLWVNIPDAQYKDCIGNENIQQEDGVRAEGYIFADTQEPTITLPNDIPLVQSEQTYIVQARFTEEIFKLNGNIVEELQASEAPKLVYCFGEGENKEIGASFVKGNIITYEIKKDSVNDDGKLHCLFVKGNL